MIWQKLDFRFLKTVNVILLIASSVWSTFTFAQRSEYNIISPEENSIVANGNLFVSIALTANRNFSEQDITILLDKNLFDVNVKISGNRISFLCLDNLRHGKHLIDIKYKTKEDNIFHNASVSFYINTKEDQLTDVGNERDVYTKRIVDNIKLSGNIIADNRSQFLSGSGMSLRQEPTYTRTLAVNLNAQYKRAQIPIHFFMTSDNYTQVQNRNYLQIGFLNKWLELNYGDINPNMDRLILSGVRMNGAKIMFKAGGSSWQFYYGELNSKSEGTLYKYLPGSGSIPSNFINDSMYMAPGTYRRFMLASRLEVGNKKDYFKVAINAFKAKDDINSIRYGITPKDNLAGGVDMTFKIFKKSLVLSSGIAGSIITNDISYGVASKKQIDSTFNTSISFDPVNYENLIILNSSTVPIIPTIKDFTALYALISFQKKIHFTSIEYRQNGPQYFSLGNPLLRNNYEGISVSERVALWKRKINVSANYQKFSNNLTQTLISKINTDMFFGSMILSIDPKYPTVAFNYILQFRNSSQGVVQSANVNDQLQTILVNCSYNTNLWNINHGFRLMLYSTSRTDDIRPQNRTDFYNAIIGIQEGVTKNFSINLEGGKTFIFNSNNERLSDINSYSGGASWQFKKYTTLLSLSVSNNFTHATIMSDESQRFSIILRSGFKLWTNLGLDLEYGYQPFKNETKPQYNYSDQFVYIRTTYNFLAPNYQ